MQQDDRRPLPDVFEVEDEVVDQLENHALSQTEGSSGNKEQSALAFFANREQSVEVELRQLQYFKAVAEEGGFGRAAERLHIVPSSVTVQVKRLERELGVALFDRTTRQVGLTEAGRALLPLADEVLAAAAQATVAIGDLVHRQERRVVLGTSSGLGDRLDAILDAFARLEPDGELRLASGTAKERVRQVRGGQLDATLVRGGEMASSLEMVKVWSDALVAAVPSRSDLGGPGPLPLSALDGVPLRLASPERSRFLHALLVTNCADAGFAPTFGPELTNDQDTLAAIAHDPKPSWTVYYASHAKRLRVPGVSFRPLRDPEPSVPTFLAIRRGDQRPGVAALIEACRTAGEAVSRRRSGPRRGGGPGRPSSGR